MSPINRFKELIILEKRDIYQLFLYAFFAGIISLSLPLGIQSIINFIQAGKISTSWIVLVIIVIIGVALVGVLKIMQFRISENLQQKIFVRASFEMAYRFPKIKESQYYNQYPPELSNRFFDTLNIQKGVSKLLLDSSTALLQILFGVILLSLYHSFFLFFGVILITLLYLIYKLNFTIGLETSLKESKYKYKVAHWLQEIARNHINFKNKNSFEFALNKNDILVNEYLGYREKHFKVLKKQFIQLIFFKVLLTAGLLIMGGLLVLNQQMNIGQFVAAEIVILSIIAAVEKLFSGLELFYDILTSLEKIGQVLDLEVEQNISNPKYDLTDTNLIDIETQNLCYKYPNSKKNTISNINLSIKTGEKVLITGENGSGKTTLMRLLARILDPTDGDIYINKTKHTHFSLDQYRSKLGIITINETPFDGTIFENITNNNPNITLAQVHQVLEKVKLTDTIKKLPKGLDTHLFPQGKQINSSVIQKIILAKSLVNNPSILLLEEPIDKLDTDTAKEIINFLTDTSNNWTLIVIAKDPYWAQRCTQTILLK